MSEYRWLVRGMKMDMHQAKAALEEAGKNEEKELACRLLVGGQVASDRDRNLLEDYGWLLPCALDPVYREGDNRNGTPLMDVPKGGYVKILKLPPGHATAQEKAYFRREVVRAVQSEKCVFAYADGGGVTCVFARLAARWMEGFEDLEVTNLGKVVKRMGSVVRTFKYRAKYEKRLAVRVLNAAEKDLYDGAFAISRGCWAKLFDHEAPVGMIGNVRILTPDGLIKGNCRVVDQLPGGVDVLVHEVNIKEEIRSKRYTYFGLEPQHSKEKVYTSTQAILAHPFLFPEVQLRAWADLAVNEARDRITEGKAVDSWDSLEASRAAIKESGRDPDKMHYLKVRKAVLKHTAKGGDYRSFPSLVKSQWDAATRWLMTVGEREDDVSLPVPYAAFEQVVSETLAREVWRIEAEPVKPGTIRRYKNGDNSFSVVSDMDWLKMRPDHGGCDMDDKFSLLWRVEKDTGRRLVCIYRYPTTRSEYSVFAYVDGDPVPGGVNGWPELDFLNAPRRSSELQADKKQEMIDPKGKAGVRLSAYDKDQVLADLDVVLAGANPGKVVNADMMFNSARMVWGSRGYMAERIKLEDVIDLCTQSPDQETIKRVMAEADRIMGKLTGPNSEVDRCVWRKRSVMDQACPGTYEGPITKIRNHLTDILNSAWLDIFGKSQGKWLQVPAAVKAKAPNGANKDDNNMLARLRLRGIIGKGKVRKCKDSQGREYEIVGLSWPEVRAELARHFEGRPAHLVSAFFETKTKKGLVSDGMLWSEDLLPLTEEALFGQEEKKSANGLPVGVQDAMAEVKADMAQMKEGLVPTSWEMDGDEEALEKIKEFVEGKWPFGWEDWFDAIAFNNDVEDTAKFLDWVRRYAIHFFNLS